MLRSFIKSLQGTVKQLSPSSRTLFVVGNEAADLDSCVSSILTAYFYHEALKAKANIGNLFQPDKVIPLLNISREDLGLRPELTYLLSNLEVDKSDLLCLEDFRDIELNRENCYAFLVDFNKLTGQVARNIDPQNVVGVIDHHDDEGLYTETANPRIVQKAGSCSSLVVTYWSGLDYGTGKYPLRDAGVINFATAPILVDTANLKFRVEPIDKEANDVLNQSSLDIDLELPNDEYFKAVEDHKRNLEGMSGRDILRKDYKQWDNDNDEGSKLRLGISSIQQPLKWLYSRHPKFDEDVLHYSQEMNVDFFVVMTGFSDDGGNFNRELVLYPFSEEARSNVEGFLTQASEKLQLEKKSGSNSANLAFDQKNIAASRKQVAPLLRAALHNIKLSNI